MGNTIHEALLVTSWNEVSTKSAQTEAVRIFGPMSVSAISPETTNGYTSFVVWPCGSKAGWPEAVAHRRKIEEMTAWVKTLDDEDGSNHIECKFASYGHDAEEEREPDARVPERRDAIAEQVLYRIIDRNDLSPINKAIFAYSHADAMELTRAGEVRSCIICKGTGVVKEPGLLGEPVSRGCRACQAPGVTSGVVLERGRGWVGE